MSATRREFMQLAAMATAIGFVTPLAEAKCARPREPIVAFFNDQPYLDFTGEAQPYVPPVGLRAAAQPSAQHMESLFHIC